MVSVPDQVQEDQQGNGSPRSTWKTAVKSVVVVRPVVDILSFKKTRPMCA